MDADAICSKIDEMTAELNGRFDEIGKSMDRLLESQERILAVLRDAVSAPE